MTQKRITIDRATNGWVALVEESGCVNKLTAYSSDEDLQKSFPELLKEREPFPIEEAIAALTGNRRI